MTTQDIRDKIQTMDVHDAYAVADILLELVEHLDAVELNINGFGSRLDTHVTKRHSEGSFDGY